MRLIALMILVFVFTGCNPPEVFKCESLKRLGDKILKKCISEKSTFYILDDGTIKPVHIEEVIEI